MARGSQPRRRRLRKARQAATAAAVVTHVSSLPDDILREIFHRLPSLATLVRAACACRAWRHAVASSPAFRSSFRALHPAPILGVLTDSDDGSLPIFAAAHRRRRGDPDVLAALRGGDFLLTSLMEEADDDVPLSWSIGDCRDGYLVLMNLMSTNLIAIVNPFSRHRPDYIELPTLGTDATEEQYGEVVFLDVHLLSSDEDPMSFRLVCLFHDKRRVRAVIFSWKTWDWRLLPWVEVEHEDEAPQWLERGTQVKGFVCWGFREEEVVLTLDTETLEFSEWSPPWWLALEDNDLFLPRPRWLVAGETKDGTLCIVRVTARGIHVWLQADDDSGGRKEWMLRNVVKYSDDMAALINNVHNNVGTPNVSRH